MTRTATGGTMPKVCDVFARPCPKFLRIGDATQLFSRLWRSLGARRPSNSWPTRIGHQVHPKRCEHYQANYNRLTNLFKNPKSNLTRSKVCGSRKRATIAGSYLVPRFAGIPSPLGHWPDRRDVENRSQVPHLLDALHDCASVGKGEIHQETFRQIHLSFGLVSLLSL